MSNTVNSKEFINTNNLYIKIQTAKKLLSSKDLKKSGKNSHLNFNYYELSDFMPSIIEIFSDLGLFSKITFTDETATLKIINIENPTEQEEYTSPMRSVTQSNPMQALGSVQTYQRRYLYMSALDITENDAIDASDGKSDTDANKSQSDGAPPMNESAGKTTDDYIKQSRENEKTNMIASGVNPNGTPTGAQLKRLYAKRMEAGITDNDTFKRLLEKHCNGKSSDKDLIISEYDFMCGKLQELIDKNKSGESA